MKKILPWFIAPAMFVALFAAFMVVATDASTKKHQDNCREKAIEETLQMTLLVGSDMRAQGKHPTWAEIQTVVRQRLGVK